MEATASAKYLRGSAQKARLVVDMIRGKDVNQALAILRFSKKRAAGHVEKCMRSAIANANEAAEKANISIDPDDLSDLTLTRRWRFCASRRSVRRAMWRSACARRSPMLTKRLRRQTSRSIPMICGCGRRLSIVGQRRIAGVYVRRRRVVSIAHSGTFVP